MALAESWQLRAGSVEYRPVGGGGHHWVLTGTDGPRHFVTVDDLDDKDWLGDTRQAVFEALRRALGTAAALRHRPGMVNCCAVLTAGMPFRSSPSWPAARTRSALTRMSGSAGRHWR
jgi:hypothetical protein